MIKLAAISLVCLFSVLLICSSAAGQSSLFGGQGLKGNSPGIRSTAKTGDSWANVIDYSNDSSAEEDTRMSFFRKPSLNFLKSNPFKRPESEQGSMLGGMPTLFPKRDPNAPGVFQQLGEKSKNFVGRTTGWAHRQNQTLRSRTQNTWSSLTGDLQQRQHQMGELFTEKSELGTQPPVRSADNPEKKPRIRF